MIPASSKFPMRTDFLEFRSSAKRASSPHFTLNYLATSAQSSCAVVVPKKVNKRATTRNWLKRLTFDTLWPVISDKNLDTVLVYKPLKLEKSPDTKKIIIAELLDVTSSL